MQVLELLVGKVALLEEGGELLLRQVTALLRVADKLAQLVRFLNRRYVG
jgi:hypothetical protein